MDECIENRFTRYCEVRCALVFLHSQDVMPDAIGQT